jgi:hypothetical protein
MISRNRVSASQMLASSPVRTTSNSFPKFSEILVNLSVKEQKKVVRKLKLVGDPYSFTEYIDKKYVPNPNNDPALRGKTVRVPFPDADLNKSFNRIGNDDEPENCPWAKLGYISTTQYAQNCFEKQDDGTWVVKILKKGKSIFKAIAKEQVDRYNNEDLDEDDPKHFGTRTSPCVRITAEATGLEGPKSVEYSVSFDPKSTNITDEMIELLRKAGEPEAQDLAEERTSYNKASKNDPYMPEWEDFYTYGYPLHKIFKPSVLKVETETIQAEPKKKFDDEEIEPAIEAAYVVKKPKVAPPVDEDDDEPVVVKPTKKAAPAPVTVEDDDEEESIGWMNE